MTQNNDHLRIGDTERIHALDALSRHYADGRLDYAEFNRRSDIITTATTQGELREQFADLPGGFPFTADTTGALVPYEQAESHSLAADVDPEAKELEKLKKKGKIINLIDGLNGTVSLAAFFLLMFVFNVSYAWLVFLAVPAIGAGARLLLRFDESEEDAYDKYQELAQKQRAQRLEQAAFKMQELENRNREGR